MENEDGSMAVQAKRRVNLHHPINEIDVRTDLVTAFKALLNSVWQGACRSA
jgi:hypothetical protein